MILTEDGRVFICGVLDITGFNNKFPSFMDILYYFPETSAKFIDIASGFLLLISEIQLSFIKNHFYNVFQKQGMNIV